MANASDDNFNVDDDDSDIERRYPHTAHLMRKIDHIHEVARELFDEIAGFTLDDVDRAAPGLCNEVESLHREVAALKEELGLLQEMRTQQVLDRYREVLLHLRQALWEAPMAQRGLFYPDDFARYWDTYEAWHKHSRGKALSIPLPPVQAEVARAQRLNCYRVREVEQASPRDATGDPDDWDWSADDSPSREQYLLLRRVPQRPTPFHIPIFEDDTGVDSCTSCGVFGGQLHLVGHDGRPICDMEECPLCRKSAAKCGHCRYAQAGNGEPARAGDSDAHYGKDDFSDLPF